MLKKTYAEKLVLMKERRTDIDLKIEKAIYENASLDIATEMYEGLKEDNMYKYFIGAMEPVDEIYTKNTYKEAERVQNQLDKIKNLNLNFDYRYQGSVSNNTHIKAHSDIDILVLINKFFSLEHPQVPANPYYGNPVEDLMELRIKCEEHLCKTFPSAKVDCEGAKSISLSGGSLKRKVDVVPSNWVNTNKYSEMMNEIYRGVQVLDKYEKKRILNTPFYHNHLLDIKDRACTLNYKKVVRLLKTLKADAFGEINFSSYDIAALIYSMDTPNFLVGNKYLLLLKNIKEYIEHILESPISLNNIYVPDKSRKIFDDSNKIQGLKMLKTEIDTLYSDISNNLSNTRMLLETKEFVI